MPLSLLDLVEEKDGSVAVVATRKGHTSRKTAVWAKVASRSALGAPLLGRARVDVPTRRSATYHGRPGEFW